MKSKIIILTITIAMLFQTPLWAGKVSQQQAMEDVIRCQEKAEQASVKHEHISTLIDLLETSSWDVTSREFDYYIKEAKHDKEQLNGRIVQLGSRGHSLKNQVENLREEHCHPCLVSNIRHFCRMADPLLATINRSLEELYQNIRENAGAFSATVTDYAEKQVSIALEHSTVEGIEIAQEMVEEAKEQVNQRNHLQAVELSFEIFRTVLPLLAIESDE